MIDTDSHFPIVPAPHVRTLFCFGAHGLDVFLSINQRLGYDCRLRLVRHLETVPPTCRNYTGSSKRRSHVIRIAQGLWRREHVEPHSNHSIILLNAQRGVSQNFRSLAGTWRVASSNIPANFPKRPWKTTFLSIVMHSGLEICFDYTDRARKSDPNTKMSPDLHVMVTQPRLLPFARLLIPFPFLRSSGIYLA